MQAVHAAWRVFAGRSGTALALAWLLAALTPAPVEAQDLEPRRWSHLPTGAWFIGVGYRYGTGDILFDPTLEIEEAEFEQHDGVLSSVYSFKAEQIPLTASTGMIPAGRTSGRSAWVCRSTGSRESSSPGSAAKPTSPPATIRATSSWPGQ